MISPIDLILECLRQFLSAGTCPKAGCIGECPACGFVGQHDDGTQHWEAYCYIWDENFNDSGQLADLLKAAGATDVIVKHVLHDTLNGDTSGKTEDDTRAWHIDIFCRDPNQADRPSEGPARSEPAGDSVRAEV